MGRIKRELFAHLINVTPSEDTGTYERLGEDLEEYNVEMNPESDEKKNILGNTKYEVSGYKPQSSVEPLYADSGTGLHQLLQKIIDGRLVGDDLKTDVLEVQLWNPTTEGSTDTFKAYKDEVVIEVSSYGGDTTGYQIPFNLHYTNKRVEGTFDAVQKTFTPTVNV